MFARLSMIALSVMIAPIAVSAQTEGPQAQGISMEEWAQYCERWDKWDKPAPPFRIHGNTYYVGTCGISSILILGAGEHILIDSGTEKGAETVLRNINTLGVDQREIKFLTYSHEHFDHVGGHALVQEATGASVMARKQIAPVFETGVVLPNDPQAGMHKPMKPVRMGLTLDSLKGLAVSGLSIRAIETPGHSPGAMTWYWKSCDKQEGREICKSIIYADSLSPVSADDYQFSDHPKYLEEYRKGIARVAAIECDILITPHPSHSNMVRRAATGTFEGGMSCREYAAGKMRDLDKRLAKEAAEASP